VFIVGFQHSTFWKFYAHFKNAVIKFIILVTIIMIWYFRTVSSLLATIQITLAWVQFWSRTIKENTIKRCKWFRELVFFFNEIAKSDVDACKHNKRRWDHWDLWSWQMSGEDQKLNTNKEREREVWVNGDILSDWGHRLVPVSPPPPPHTHTHRERGGEGGG